MSVLIKGMEMPKNCMSCPFPAVGVDAYYCHCPTQDGKEYDFKCAETIPDDCPLVEIPTPHGDLVDRNELLAEYDRQHEGEAGKARKIMEQAKTVIEAEGETDGR